MKRGMLMKLQLGLLLLALLLPQPTDSQDTIQSQEIAVTADNLTNYQENTTGATTPTSSSKTNEKKPKKSGAGTLQWSVSMLVVSTSLFLHFYH